MRHAMDRFYGLGGALAALQLLIIMLMIVIQVLGRIIDNTLLMLHQPPWGLNVPGLAEIAGFLLLGASFFGLAYTFRAGAHIRVTLIIQHLPRAFRQVMEALMILLALGITLYAAWNGAWLAYDSYDFGDVSIGMVPVPLWIPQSAMSAGLLWLAIALVDTLFEVLKGNFATLNHSEVQE
ncbi:C4-dicarboxylate ABC transporter permease [Terasakiispira papahanaumokuakeensis]|uniref:TRAP transporter small permease protein n=1 Tax=Terasakiispira papahanaumokuakeensis TaxID=197479 RepID=A0A1E2V9D5_9GAMM|nr:TRAP transporter small permease [Terasakiispira papahanaumokuakeensis]ODC03629.1 C4-dicarboxylate ABC transporter permease [Terasakiispira papahanaumokuakeensis]